MTQAAPTRTSSTGHVTADARVKLTGKRGPATVKKGSILTTGFWVPLFALLAFIACPRPHELLQPFERVYGDTPNSQPISTEQYDRTNKWFSSGDKNGTMLSAWKYLPKDWRGLGRTDPPPLVIMAHGLGSQRDFGLHLTAEVFAKAGLAVLVFDYRTFGGSDGEPRHWVSPTRHVEDWRAAVKYAMSAPGSEWDPKRIVLWGTSFSGGHVLVVASELKDEIRGVISQVPHLSGKAAAKISIKHRGLLPSVRLIVAGIYDTLRAKLGLSPVYVPLAGPHNSVSVMAMTPSERKSYHAKHPQVMLGGWRNQAMARMVVEGAKYSPIDYVPNITAPTLLIAAEYDTLCPTEVVKQAADILGVDALLFPVDHFALYLSEVWAQSMAQMVAFVCEVTGLENCPVDEKRPVKPLVTRVGGKHKRRTI